MFGSWILPSSPHTLSAHLSLALRDRGFLFRSSSEGMIGLSGDDPEGSARTGLPDALANDRNVSLTIRSSREWKEMTQIRPPSRKNLQPLSSTCLRFSNSLIDADPKGLKGFRGRVDPPEMRPPRDGLPDNLSQGAASSQWDPASLLNDRSRNPPAPSLFAVAIKRLSRDRSRRAD